MIPINHLSSNFEWHCVSKHTMFLLLSFISFPSQGEKIDSKRRDSLAPQSRTEYHWLNLCHKMIAKLRSIPFAVMISLDVNAKKKWFHYNHCGDN